MRSTENALGNTKRLVIYPHSATKLLEIPTSPVTSSYELQLNSLLNDLNGRGLRINGKDKNQLLNEANGRLSTAHTGIVQTTIESILRHELGDDYRTVVANYTQPSNIVLMLSNPVKGSLIQLSPNPKEKYFNLYRDNGNIYLGVTHSKNNFLMDKENPRNIGGITEINKLTKTGFQPHVISVENKDLMKLLQQAQEAARAMKMQQAQHIRDIGFLRLDFQANVIKPVEDKFMDLINKAAHLLQEKNPNMEKIQALMIDAGVTLELANQLKTQASQLFRILLPKENIADDRGSLSHNQIYQRCLSHRTLKSHKAAIAKAITDFHDDCNNNYLPPANDNDKSKALNIFKANVHTIESKVMNTSLAKKDSGLVLFIKNLAVWMTGVGLIAAVAKKITTGSFLFFNKGRVSKASENAQDITKKLGKHI